MVDLSERDLHNPDPITGARPRAALMFHPELGGRQADWVPNVRWSCARVLVSLPTANYLQFLSLPSAGILAGRELGLSAVQILYLSRQLTGLVALGVGALVIAIANGVAPWIFTILTLPMSLLLTVIACGAFVALLVRAIRHVIPLKEGVALKPPASVRDAPKVLAALAADFAVGGLAL